MPLDIASRDELDRRTRTFYCGVLTTLREARVPFLVGGGYALDYYTGLARRTKDCDVYVCPRDFDRALGVLSSAGYRAERTFHWIGKVAYGEELVDVIYSSVNGVPRVDDRWFERAVEAELLGVPVKLCPPEELIWAKAFVMERERYDGADIIHLLRACGESLDWPHLLRRFDRHWRVLLSHLILIWLRLSMRAVARPGLGHARVARPLAGRAIGHRPIHLADGQGLPGPPPVLAAVPARCGALGLSGCADRSGLHDAGTDCRVDGRLQE